MPRATLPPPARTLAVVAATIVVALGAVLAIGTAPAEAATPCWKRALDDWADNGRMDRAYTQACLQAAIDHLPEDLRMYSTAPEVIGGARQPSARRGLAGAKGTKPSSGSARRTVAPVKEIEPRTGPRDEGPIQSVLGKGTTDASSIPVPLMVLAGLALLLMAAGAAGFAQRKLHARRGSSGRS
jgi:hypothetical protein